VLEPGFDQLKVGTEVRFDEEMGEQGPQATKSKRSIATLSHCESYELIQNSRAGCYPTQGNGSTTLFLRATPFAT